MRPASFAPGAFHRRSAIEVPWPWFPSANRFIAALAAMNPRPPATSARLCRRALASAPTVPPGRFGAFAFCALRRLPSFIRWPAPNLSPRGRSLGLIDWRSVARRLLPGTSDPRARPSNRRTPLAQVHCLQDPFGARWQAFFLSNRVSGVFGARVLIEPLGGRFQPRFRELFPTSRRRAGSSESGAGAGGASPPNTNGIPTTFARAPAAPIPCYPNSTKPSTSRRRPRDECR